MVKKYFILIIVVSVLLVSCAVTCTVLFNQSSKQSEFIFTLFRPKLQKASDNFYSHYLSDNPIVYNYSGIIISLNKSGLGYYIEFGIEPVIGPHDPVGYDVVEYYVDNTGTIKFLSFSHKKNYEIPPLEGVTIKKPIPISQE